MLECLAIDPAGWLQVGCWSCQITHTHIGILRLFTGGVRMHLYHYFERKIGPFRNLSDLPISEAEEVLQK